MIKQIELLSRPHFERELADAIRRRDTGIDTRVTIEARYFARDIQEVYAEEIRQIEDILSDIEQAEGAVSSACSDGYEVLAHYPLTPGPGVTLILHKADEDEQAEEASPDTGSISFSDNTPNRNSYIHFTYESKLLRAAYIEMMSKLLGADDL